MVANGRTAVLGRLAVLAAALIWGASFVGMKELTAVMPVQYVLAIRFTLSAAVMSLALLPRLKRLTRSTVWRGLCIGAFLYAAYAFQTYGVSLTTPGKNAFLTAIYCVLVPFLYWLVDRVRPDRFNLIAAVAAVIGIGMVSLDGDLSLGLGDGLTLVGGVFFAAHMVAIAKLSRGRDALLITLFQFVGTAVCAWVGALLFEEAPPLAVFTPEIVGVMAYLVLCATCLTLTFQTYGQQHTPPSAAAILLSLESVFGVIVSVIAGERPSPIVYGGFAVIFLAVLISETKLSFLRRKRR
ncbi:MAG: DMT family transporter [Clostridia bacterium]|nr:DMT family transporter [Clostridia bacterium]